jgi:exonuclease VII small subunit
MVNQLHQAQRNQSRHSDQTLQAAKRILELTRSYETALRELERVAQRLKSS